MTDSRGLSRFKPITFNDLLPWTVLDYFEEYENDFPILGENPLRIKIQTKWHATNIRPAFYSPEYRLKRVDSNYP